MRLDDPLQIVREWARQLGISDSLLLAAAGVLVVLMLIVLVRRRRRRALVEQPSLAVDLAEVGDEGPPEDVPQLHCYALPVRLAVLVLAPAGRGAEVPEDVQRSAALEQIVPGLARVAATHGTLVKVWPPQLSPRGFAHAFFANVKLPGDVGKGTPWCSLAGKFEVGGQHYMAGMALCARKPNSLSQYVIDRPSEWLDVLRAELR